MSSLPSFSRRMRGRLSAMRWSRAVEERFTAPRGRPDSRRYFVVSGDDPLAHRLTEELAKRYDAEVAVILPSRTRNHGPQIARIPGVRLIESPEVDSDALLRADVARADAIGLVRQNDVGNIDAALIAKELNPGARLVVRMFNMSLGHRVRRLIDDCVVLSDAAMASPAFVSAALGEVEVNHVRLPGRTLYVANRHEVKPHQVVCGLAVSSQASESGSTAVDDGPQMLPAEASRADLVLAIADGEGPSSLARPGEGGERRNGWRRYNWRVPALRDAVQALVDRKLWLAAAALIGVLLAGTVALAPMMGLSLWDAAYVTLLTAVGGANPDPDGLRTPVQVTQTVITLAGIALVPVITAAVVEAVLNARLAAALGRLRQPVADHVVVVGLGNVGTRVIRGLHEFGVPVVAIDRVPTARGADLARRLDIPLVIGDASQEETLRAASVENCRALVVLSTDDNVNLEAALSGRGLKPDLRVVLRLFDGDFARRVQRAFGVAISHSVSYVAAPAFAAAMMERDVLATIPVGRRVLLIAEVAIGPGAELDGATVATANVSRQAQVLALHPHHESRIRWGVPAEHRIVAHDRLIVVATRAGLARIVDRTTSPTPDTEAPVEAPVETAPPAPATP